MKRVVRENNNEMKVEWAACNVQLIKITGPVCKTDKGPF